jgi:hypothetical protein
MARDNRLLKVSGTTWAWVNHSVITVVHVNRLNIRTSESERVEKYGVDQNPFIRRTNECPFIVAQTIENEPISV